MDLATIKRKKHYMSVTSNGGGCFLKLSIIRIEPYNPGKLNNASNLSSLFNLQPTPFQSFTPTDFRLRRALRLSNKARLQPPVNQVHLMHRVRSPELKNLTNPTLVFVVNLRHSFWQPAHCRHHSVALHILKDTTLWKVCGCINWGVSSMECTLECI